LFIPYLLSGNYYGVEPNQWLIDEGIKENLGESILTIKKPHFSNNSKFMFTEFDTKFDYILAQSIFTHACQNEIKQCLKMANKVMHDDSIFALTFLEDNKNSNKDFWTYPDCVKYRLDFLKQLANNEGLSLEKIPNNENWFIIKKLIKE